MMMHSVRTPRLLATRALRAPTLPFARAAPFHASTCLAVKAGDAIPDLEVLKENSPGNTVNLAKELKGNGLIIGVPAAFSRFSIFFSLIFQCVSTCGLCMWTLIWNTLRTLMLKATNYHLVR